MSDQYETRRGQLIGEYRLMQKLGRGGFGTVYLAEHIHEHSQVAIKILQVPLAKSEDFREFLNETRMMIRLWHPHIIPLLDVGLSREDFPFLVMEYASLGALRDHHPKGSQLPLATIAEYIEQIASALQYAHDHRIIHCDVKPENMLLRADSTLLLSDFGIAKIIEHSTLMGMQNQIGTPVYMAPEQYKGYPCFASDQYTLAVVAYEWISGTRPFQGTREWLAVQHATAPPPSLLNLLPTLPPSIEQVIFKALSKVPEQRFATVQEFAAAFRTTIQQATVPQVDMKRLTLEEPLSKEAITQQPVATVLIHTEPQNTLWPTPQPLLMNQSIQSGVAQIRQASAEMNNPLSPNQPYPTTHALALSPFVAAGKPSSGVKPFRRLSPFRGNFLLLSSGLLVGVIILALVISMMGVKSQKQQISGNTSPNHTPSSGHPAPTVPVLNANTVSGLVKKWAFARDSSTLLSPAVVDGVVYLGSEDSNVYAIDAQSGQLKWAFQTGDFVGSSPTVVGGVVYIGSYDHNVYAIDAQSGQKKWAFQTGGNVWSSPALVGGVVYVGSWDHNVYAIDAQSGRKKWAFLTGDMVYSSPAVVGGVVYIGSNDGNIYAIDAQSGQKKWAFPTGNAVSSSPAVVDGVAYIGSNDGNVYAIDAQSGQKKWAFLTRSVVESSPAVIGGMVYIGSEDHNIYAIDAQSGQKKWAFLTGDTVWSSPAVVGGVVYVGSADSNVYAIGAQSGQQRWVFQTGSYVQSSPAVVNSAVYIGSSDGYVYAFGLPTTAP